MRIVDVETKAELQRLRTENADLRARLEAAKAPNARPGDLVPNERGPRGWA